MAIMLMLLRLLCNSFMNRMPRTSARIVNEVIGHFIHILRSNMQAYVVCELLLGRQINANARFV